MKTNTKFEDYILLEMLHFKEYSPELYDYFGGPTVNCHWYSTLANIYNQKLSKINNLDKYRHNIESWNERNNGVIYVLFQGYLTYYFELKTILNELEINTNTSI